MGSLEDRLAALRALLRDIGPCLVAFSGGVDSTFLLRVAHDVLGEGAVAVTAVSASLPASERDAALDLARRMGVRHLVIETREMDDPGYVRNDGRRCYYCKRELFSVLRSVVDGARGRTIVYGAIPDDLGEERPGMRAAAEAGVRAPLIEAGIDKRAIRELSRRLGLPTWNKPAMACLASRIPRHTEVTAAALARVERAEAALRALGYRQVRVRYRGSGARVELDPEGLARSGSRAARRRLVAAVRSSGFDEVLIDPLGYRPGGADAPAGPQTA
ncbi:MAG: ATP-dependent sacrificial sulfur transferase LarE [Acidobacteriota bacterium]